MQQHSRLPQPNTHVCMKLECQHLIHAAGWWLWNKLCQRVAAAKFHWAAADSGYVEVIAGRRFGFINCDKTFYVVNLKVCSSSQKLRENIFWRNCVFNVFLSGRQWNLSSLMEVGVVKEDLMGLGNWVIIVIQDKDAYCHRQGVRCKWKSSYSDIVSSKTRFF